MRIPTLSLEQSMIFLTGLGFFALGIVGTITTSEVSGVFTICIFLGIGGFWMVRAAPGVVNKRVAPENTHVPLLARIAAWLFSASLLSTIVSIVVWTVTASKGSEQILAFSAVALLVSTGLTVLAIIFYILWKRVVGVSNNHPGPNRGVSGDPNPRERGSCPLNTSR